MSAGASPLLCPVRDCRRPLAREERRVVCTEAHSFDVARSGYINLLQPQDRRSKLPGDSATAVAARRRLHDRGLTAPLAVAIEDFAGASEGDSVLDAGCGDGFYLGSIARESGCAAHGVDISVSAVEAAARRYPGCQWIVANADRFIPYADQSFGLVLSITGRMNAEEFRRLLPEEGRLVIALPSPEDLVELRGSGRNRIARTMETFSQGFQLAKRRRVIASAELDTSAVEDILLSIYRPMRSQPVRAMRVTLGLDLLMFQKTRQP